MRDTFYHVIELTKASILSQNNVKFSLNMLFYYVYMNIYVTKMIRHPQDSRYF